MNWDIIIESLLKEFRMSSIEFQEKTGVSNAIVSQLKTGKTKRPNQFTIKRIEEGLGIKIDDSDPDNITYRKTEQKKSGFEGEIAVTKLPLLSEGYAGEPQYLDTEYHDEYYYAVNLNAGHKCFALKVKGKSMETTLKDGWIVLVDMDAAYREGDIVAVRLKNGEQYIKRFFDMNYAFVKLTSDNSEYGVRLIDKNDIDKIYKVVATIHNPDER